MLRISYILVLCTLSFGFKQVVNASKNNYTYAAAALVGTDMYMNAEENPYTKYSQTQEATVLRGILHVLRPCLLLPAYSCVSKEFQHSIHPHVKKNISFTFGDQKPLACSLCITGISA